MNQQYKHDNISGTYQHQVTGNMLPATQTLYGTQTNAATITGNEMINTGNNHILYCR
jgi:hypothetical protein